MMKYSLFIIIFAANLLLFITAFSQRWFDPLTTINYRLDYAPAIIGGDELSFYRHYHNLDGSVELANNSDVIVYGNSRSLIALSGLFDVNVKKNFKLNVFFIAQGYGAKGAYLYEFLKKHPIKNKVFIINVDSSFFNPKGLSIMAKKVIAQDAEQAQKTVISANLKWQFVQSVNSVFPLKIPGRIICRDMDNEAWWYYSGEPQGHKEIKYRDDIDKIPQNNKEFSKKLIALLRRNNNKIVFIGVPVNSISYKTIEYFSQINDVPCYLKKIQGLYSNDDSHLEKKSAKIYSDWLESQLHKELSTFQKENRERSQVGK